ncbi:DUF2161 family putative PD-(D/E)XK-type phosphodiesterase [Maritimibacter sp. UBA3975]|uniref:DUF2161 domain-containing phosphodiesterase n=1 Tax=Maritimibacter sp. UBA3975 TaxID=1946833 RepID=UPI000C0B5671|nr:DUF2161 family putative PD-(D/E)XK-type phosphodiesterase [Maritimibacter sp. UBA3975]MAM61453.1 hypothetical protein [Maritimibacter sp.]|tara:strand:- start:6 stop:659 length:654 start_codon:yes stop_codon:yes gene_type:complete
MGRVAETDLYAPVKAWLEALGYEVKAEIGPVDVMAVRDGGDPVVVELKAGFSLTLLQQAVARQAVTDNVYVAVPRWAGRAGWRAFKGNVGLCKRLGLGVLSVRLADGAVQVHADPSEFRPRKSKVRRDRLLSEFARREGDPNLGGVRGQVMTAYKQDCARIAAHLAAHGPAKGAEIAKATGVAKATRMMYLNHLGWFARVDTGLYDLTDKGRVEHSA